MTSSSRSYKACDYAQSHSTRSPWRTGTTSTAAHNRELGRIGDIGDPPAAGRLGGEVPFQQVRGPLGRRGGDRGPRLLPPGRRARDAQLAHQPLHRAAGHLDAFPPQLEPHFPRPIQPPALFPVLPHAHDLLLQLFIPHLPSRSLTLAFLRRIIGGGGKFQDRADRLDPEPVTV